MSDPVRRLLLTIAYDGAPHRGWQSQPGGNTIQDHIESALAAVCKRPVRAHGAGRTDAGVHALRQSAHADVPPLAMDGTAWCLALNNRLPPSIRVMAAQWTSPDFHARFHATAKHYRYVLRNATILPPHEAGRVWLVPHPLNLPAIERAAQSLTGRHDFRRFSAIRKSDDENTTRSVQSITLTRHGRLLRIDFTADGFLYKMARILTASLVRSGTGRLSPDDIRNALNHPHERRLPHCAPPDGLHLVRVIHKRGSVSNS